MRQAFEEVGCLGVGEDLTTVGSACVEVILLLPHRPDR